MSLRGEIISRLIEGPATVDELAYAVWGPDFRWPLHYKQAIYKTVYDLRHQGADIENHVQTWYHLNNARSIALQRAMDK